MPSGSASPVLRALAPAASSLPSAPGTRLQKILSSLRINANNGPHSMVVGHDGHLQPPDHIEDCQVRRMIKLLHFGPLGLAETLRMFADGKSPRYHFTHMLCVGSASRADRQSAMNCSRSNAVAIGASEIVCSMIARKKHPRQLIALFRRCAIGRWIRRRLRSPAGRIFWHHDLGE